MEDEVAGLIRGFRGRPPSACQLLSRELENAHEGTRLVHNLHGPLAARPELLAFILQHLAGGHKCLLANLPATTEDQSFIVGEVFPLSDMKKVSGHRTASCGRREHI